MHRTIHLTLALTLSVLCGCSSSARLNNQNQSNAPANGELHFKAPDGWVTEKPTSSMRAAQYKLPKADGDPEDAS